MPLDGGEGDASKWLAAIREDKVTCGCFLHRCFVLK